MEIDWFGRLLEWREEAERSPKKRWWTFPLLLLLLLPGDLLWHRLLTYVNDAIDQHGDKMPKLVASALGSFLTSPVPLAVIVAIIIFVGLVVHAYFDTRKPPITERVNNVGTSRLTHYRMIGARLDQLEARQNKIYETIELLGKNGRAADERLKKLEFHANNDYIVHAELQSRIEALEGANPRAVPQVKEHL